MQRHLLTFLFLFIALFSILAQDTVRVQTFTWEDNSRSDYFTFPDDPNQSYEKILMRYNMRCHDAAIGNGDVGCREWDYSCNTFLTDSSREDSLAATHPDHLLYGYDVTSIPYTNTPFYIYTQYEQIQTTVNSSTNINEATLGSTGSPLHLPGASQQVERHQYLYTAEELTNAGLMPGEITSLSFNILDPSQGAHGFMRIRLKETNRTTMHADSMETQGFTEVYFNNLSLEDTGWTSIPFYQAFEWDGSSSIILDLSTSGGPYNVETRIDGSSESFMCSAGATDQSQAPYYLGLNGYGWMELPPNAFGHIEEISVAFWSYGLAYELPNQNSVFEAVDDFNHRQMNVHLPWSDGTIYWDCGNDGSGYDRIQKAANPSEFEGSWQFWVFTKNATSGEMKIFLNGEIWHSGTGKTKPIDISNFMFGRNISGDRPYPGSLDNISIWHKALELEDVQRIMLTEDIPNDLAAEKLAYHYPLNEGNGNIAEDMYSNFDATLVSPNWQSYRGKDLQFDWYVTTYRPHLRLVQADLDIENESVFVVDSVEVNPIDILTYEVDASNDLVNTGSVQTYLAGATYLYDEEGNILDVYYVPEDGYINVEDLNYHIKQPAKFEILSLVTPYGNGLDLGQGGKTFTFDVTDYGPILKGEKYLSIEMGGQNQEEMDIEFLFIKGTPQRDVIDISNVWPFARGWYADIQDDKLFEPRTLALDQSADFYKLRSSITGHGQNGEFVPRQHYLNINGGDQEFQFDVWKSCGMNPIYPQGGTWVFDRAGWCPGMATDVHTYYLPSDVGNSVVVDYGVNGATLTEANYLVSTQLVTYGAPNFTLDAAIEDIIRPSKKVEHERFNPGCNEPIILVKNNGITEITSLDIDYNVVNGNTLTYNWTGNLAANESIEIALPVNDYHFFDSQLAQPKFEVNIYNINGEATDEYTNNNSMQTDYDMADILDYEETLFMYMRTNNRPGENRYYIKNASGETVLQRNLFTSSTTYQDEITLPPGCYSLTLEDDGGDGLDFWYWAAVGENVGTGNASIRRQLSPTLLYPVKNFDPDFGGDLHYDFIIPGTVDSKEITEARRFSIYPNPTSDFATIELTGYTGKDVQWQLLDINGRILKHNSSNTLGQTHFEEIRLHDLNAGIYVVRVVIDKKVFAREIVVTP